ncbi:MAG: hypothetical protein JWO06_3769 [Bacteroidota bacterium]|nr:hypothetical protein [Bacteroidota bacterium]
MKYTFLILFVLLLSLNSQLKAQPAYNKFLVEGAHWEIDKFYCDWLGTCDPGAGAVMTDVYHGFYKLEGDTIIDSTIYKKMYFCYWSQCFKDPSFSEVCPHSGPTGDITYRLFAFFSEDTIARKVYWRPLMTSQCPYDTVFLDFSWNMGDTVNLYGNENFGIGGGPTCFNYKYGIDSVNNVGFQNYIRKTWNIKQVSPNIGPEFQLYEGIGYSYGFDLEFYDGDAFIGDYPGAFLISYCVGNDSVCDGRRFLSINDIPSDKFDVTLQPNPTSDNLIVKTEGAQIKLIEILDINGRTMLSSTLIDLNVSNLAPAVYFVIVNTNLGTVRKRLVKL